MKVVLDSNVIIAAFATRGFCHEIFELCLRQHQVFTSEFILKECRQKFHAKLKLPDVLCDRHLAYLKTVMELVKPEFVAADFCRDKDDRAILGTALACQADVLISGDKDLLDLKRIQQVHIVTPREFWELLSRG